MIKNYIIYNEKNELLDTVILNKDKTVTGSNIYKMWNYNQITGILCFIDKNSQVILEFDKKVDTDIAKSSKNGYTIKKINNNSYTSANIKFSYSPTVLYMKQKAPLKPSLNTINISKNIVNYEDKIKKTDYDKNETIQIPIVKSEKNDVNDHRAMRHSRDRYNAFPVGKYINPPPMLFTRDGHNCWEADMYRGKSAFLLLGGPSFGDLIKTDIEINNKNYKVDKLLKSGGFCTMGVNNSVKSFRPDLWVSVDNPTHFMKSIWTDPKIKKYVPYDHCEKNIFDNEKWELSNILVGDCPNVLYYRRNEKFQPKQFMYENTFNWGNHSEFGGGRSVMLVAIRLLYYLGFRKVFLLGCDFKMDENNKYHFDQDRTKASINGNNASYQKLKQWFDILKPEFDKLDYQIFNCNYNSELKTFPFISFKDAYKLATEDFVKDIDNEKTCGLYERESLIKGKK